MKTDRFTDSIRRKLESIRPEFTEKDWTRMQATLRQASPPQPGASGTNQPSVVRPGQAMLGQPWLLAAAAVSTIVLVGVSLWQRNEIDHLRQTVQHLNQRPAGPIQAGPNEVATGMHRNDDLPIRADTVYVTRYVEVPARPRSAERGPGNRDPAERGPVVPPKSYAGSSRMPSSENAPVQSINPVVSSQTKSDEEIATLPITNSSVTKSPGQSATTTKTGQASKNRLDMPPANEADNPTGMVGNAPVNAAAVVQAGETGRSFVQYEQLASRPLVPVTINWSAALNRRAKSLRPARALPTTESAAPESQPIERMATRFRLGVGTDLGTRFWSAGVVGEVLVGRHWTLGLGLGRATYMGGLFLTDDDFFRRTKLDFRRNYAPGLGPGRDILNIDTRMVQWQVPVSLGYRIPLNQTLTLLPTIGTSLNLSSTENVTYYAREQMHGFSKAGFSADRPVSLANSLVFGTALAWQRGHWVVQGGPLVTIPTAGPSPQPEPDWQSAVAVGMRLRVFYQF